ncbi:YciI family protein [Spirillospora albida]|uniref:YciI family protein n=1 Tax=Spirillospora albida TaxID=58123 RepID=UPI0004BF1864|nr:YciI family protein [Spirillospora albida]
MKLYALNMFQPVGERPPPEVLDPIMKELFEIRRELEMAESWVFGAGFHEPSASTVVRVRGSDVVATDGPYTEGKEHLGGITIIKVQDLDEALEWAGQYARITGLPIEVRPFQSEG